ncbi:MAG: hypothetical protein AAFO99_09885 [Bacteroidota bacterium]
MNRIRFHKVKCLVSPFVFVSLYSHLLMGQRINVPPKLLATYNTHLSFSLGADLSYVGKNGDLELILPNGATTGDNIRFREGASWSLSLGMDLYSPNGVLGLYVAAEYNAQKYAVEGTPNQRLDSIASKNLEVPVYLKFRLGKTTGKSHLWAAFGGGYSFPLSTKFNSRLGSTKIAEEPFKVDLFKPIPFLSSILGYEYYLKAQNGQYTSSIRTLLYLKGNYDLGNRINGGFIAPEESSISQISDLDIQLLRISFGIRFLFQ